MNNKRLRALLLAGTIATSISFTDIAHAASKYALTTANLNFRTSPSTSGKIITTIKKNSKVEVISYSGNWAKIKYNNKTGYSSKQYLKNVTTNTGSTNGTTSTSKKIGKVTADVLNVRSGAGTNYSKIGTVKEGQTVTILQTSNGWHKIELSGGKTGWVKDDYVKITSTTTEGTTSGNSSSNSGSTSGTTSTSKKTGTVTADVLNVRSGAGTNYSKITTVKKNQKVTILQTSNGWHKIELSGGKTGWVKDDYVKITSTTTEGTTSGNSSSNGGSTSGTTSTSKKTGTVTADVLNVRSGAGTNYSKITTVKKNQTVTIFQTSNGWHKIELSGGKTGWVSASYIKISDSNSGSGSSNNNESTTQKPLPTPTETPTYVDAPVNSAVIDSKYDQYQNMITVDKGIDSTLKSLSIKSNESFEVEYSTYSNGSWNTSSNGDISSNANESIEGVRIKLNNAPSNYHIFYRVKVENQGWQNWVKDNDIAGEIQVKKAISDIDVRLILEDNASNMVKETIAIDLGHNVPRPVERGAVNGVYDEDYLIREVGKKVVYKLRTLGYNVVETKPTGYYTQSDELKARANAANANEVDKFVSIHFNSGTEGANGTEVYYSTNAPSKTLASNVTNNIVSSFGFKNRGIKDGSHLAVLRNTKMPAILVEGCFLDQIDMNKFISKGSQAYEIMADDIVSGIIK